MIELFVNGLSASAGGGLTYLRNLIPQLAARADVKATILLPRTLCVEFSDQANLRFMEGPGRGTAVRRLAWEQLRLPELIRRQRAEALISCGNVALWNSPVPQILLSRNSLYTSSEFYRDLRNRREYGMWLENRVKAAIARRSIDRADITIAPSAAFAGELQKWSGREVAAIPHGFDRAVFWDDRRFLSADVQSKIDQAAGCLRLLFVSHYNYYRSFETLLHALALLQERLARPVKLFLTCTLTRSRTPGNYDPASAAKLVSTLKIAGAVTELGAIPYRSLHQLYRACDIYVTPAYAESFAHPLVEAMSAGLPVVASDLAVHREICGQAALYFDQGSSQQLAKQVAFVAESQALAGELSQRGRKRSLDFSWEKHAAELVRAAAMLTGKDSHIQLSRVAS